MRQMWHIVKVIDKFGVEVRGIERVLPHERSPVTSRDWLDNLWMWLAANCTVRRFLVIRNRESM